MIVRAEGSGLTVLYVITVLVIVAIAALNIATMIIKAKYRKAKARVISERKEQTPEVVVPLSCYTNPILDFELCVGLDELKETVRQINQSKYFFAGVTQNGETYTVFFRRYV